MIHSIPYQASEGLRAENEIHDRNTAPLTREWQRGNYPTAADFIRDYAASAEGFEVEQAMRTVEPGASVLDVGSGYGKASVLLALRGFSVTAADPARGFCEYLDRTAGLYGLDVDIYQVPGERLDQLDGPAFDACLFNASLHHCDDPVRALTNCHRLLKPRGRLLLLNEPILQLFRSKRWFRKQLEQGTLITGDYGGNEHTYYHHEYRAMLRRAGFRRIRDWVVQRYRDPRSYLTTIRSANRGGTISVAARKAYYGGIRGLLRSGVPGTPLVALLKRLSLIQTNFVAEK